VAAIDCVHVLKRRHAPPFASGRGFADLEGVRPVLRLGSRAIAGTFGPNFWTPRWEGFARDARVRADPAGRDAARRRDDVLAYAELHIEQGPVLEAEGLPVGVVTAINGASRFLIEIEGLAGHAGTVPMSLRRDASPAAAECVLATNPAAPVNPTSWARWDASRRHWATNVIPGHARFHDRRPRTGDDQRRHATADTRRPSGPSAPAAR
jgi:allantoate deiminase